MPPGGRRWNLNFSHQCIKQPSRSRRPTCLLSRSAYPVVSGRGHGDLPPMRNVRPCRWSEASWSRSTSTARGYAVPGRLVVCCYQQAGDNSSRRQGIGIKTAPFPPTPRGTLYMGTCCIFSQIADREGVVTEPVGCLLLPLLGATVTGWETAGRGFVCAACCQVRSRYARRHDDQICTVHTVMHGA